MRVALPRVRGPRVQESLHSWPAPLAEPHWDGFTGYLSPQLQAGFIRVGQLRLRDLAAAASQAGAAPIILVWMGPGFCLRCGVRSPPGPGGDSLMRLGAHANAEGAGARPARWGKRPG